MNVDIEKQTDVLANECSLLLQRKGSKYENSNYTENGKSVKFETTTSPTIIHRRAWGATPTLRKIWTSNVLVRVRSSPSSFLISDPSISWLPSQLMSCVNHTPGLVIAVILNLFLSMSFGQAFFPSEWTFPNDVPRAIGVQMFLFSTTISQIVMTSMSKFPTAQGMMMVENIPFMHTLANIAMHNLGSGRETFATLFIAFSLSSILVGIFFFILGYFKLGNAVYFFPRHVIIGCVGGIGIFLIITSIEVSTRLTWVWNIRNISNFFSINIYPFWLATLGFELVLVILMKISKLSYLPPFYFISIPILFYIILYLFHIPLNIAHENGWFFPSSSSVNSLLIWELFDFRMIHWSTIGQMIPTIISLTIFR